MKVLIRCGSLGKETRWAKCYPTCHPQFVINHEHVWGDKGKVRIYKRQYTLTHKRTGLALTHRCTSISLLRKLAGAISGIPLEWSKITRAQAAQKFYQFPPTIQNWIREVRDTPLTTKEHGRKVTRKSRKSSRPARQKKVTK